MANKKRKNIIKGGMFWALIFALLLQVGIFIGCATIQPMSDDTVYRFDLKEEWQFEGFQYYVSRDVMLRVTRRDIASASREERGRARTEVLTVDANLIASTPGILAKAEKDDRTGQIVRLGIVFETDAVNQEASKKSGNIELKDEVYKDDRYIVWFRRRSADDSYFYLEYYIDFNDRGHNPKRKDYYGAENPFRKAGDPLKEKYTVYFETRGVEAALKGVVATDETKGRRGRGTKKLDYKNTEPLLLYKEIEKKKEKKKTMKGIKF